MGKTACKMEKFENSENPRYECKKCGARVKKEEKVCKPQKLEFHK
jgi:hypothetical protein